jgi:biotin carboxyl carrier protein
MHKVEVNSNFAVEIEAHKNGLKYNGRQVEWDKVPVKDNHFSIIWNGKNYDAEFVAVDRAEKAFSVRVNNGLYHLQVKDQFDLLLEKLGMHQLQSGQVLDIKAPMPGLVLSVKVKEGDEVQEGEPVVVLEAMKMENELRAALERNDLDARVAGIAGHVALDVAQLRSMITGTAVFVPATTGIGLLVGHRLFAPGDPENPSRLERLVKTDGLAGLRLSPIYDREKIWMNDPVCYPLWEKAQDLGAVFNIFLAPEQNRAGRRHGQTVPGRKSSYRSPGND